FLQRRVKRTSESTLSTKWGRKARPPRGGISAPRLNSRMLRPMGRTRSKWFQKIVQFGNAGTRGSSVEPSSLVQTLFLHLFQEEIDLASSFQLLPPLRCRSVRDKLPVLGREVTVTAAQFSSFVTSNSSNRAEAPIASPTCRPSRSSTSAITTLAPSRANMRAVALRSSLCLLTWFCVVLLAGCGKTDDIAQSIG